MLYFKILFRGFGQIMLQNNMFSGILFFCGLLISNPILSGAALLGVVVNSSAAYFLKAEREEIINGLHGFNGALIGIAIWTFFEINIWSFLAIIIGSILAVPVSKRINDYLPAYTAPFVVITWMIILILRFLFLFLLPENAEIIADSADLLAASTNGFGQVMFQENMITGILFFAGILVNSRLSAIYALYASITGALVALLFIIPTPSINAGLMGYNAILCAIALGDKKNNRFLWISLTVITSVLLNRLFLKLGIIPLTAPFVIATWIFIWLRKTSTSMSRKLRKES